jgi:hypothetical protein
MAGAINMNSNLITSLQTSNTLTDAISKYQVDNEPYKAPFSVTLDPAPAIVNETYLVDVSGGPVTFTLPASPAEGSKVTVVDKVGTSSQNPITIVPSLNNYLRGVSVIDVDNTLVTLVYSTGVWYQISCTKAPMIEPTNLYTGDYIGLNSTSSSSVSNVVTFNNAAYTQQGHLTKSGNAVAVTADRLYKITFGFYAAASADYLMSIQGSSSGILVEGTVTSLTSTRTGMQRLQVYHEPTANENITCNVSTNTTVRERYFNVVELTKDDLNVMVVKASPNQTPAPSSTITFDTLISNYGSTLTWNSTLGRIEYQAPAGVEYVTFYTFLNCDVETRSNDGPANAQYAARYTDTSSTTSTQGPVTNLAYPLGTYVVNSSSMSHVMSVASTQGFFDVLYTSTAGLTGSTFDMTLEVLIIPQ